MTVSTAPQPQIVIGSRWQEHLTAIWDVDPRHVVVWDVLDGRVWLENTMPCRGQRRWFGMTIKRFLKHWNPEGAEGTQRNLPCNRSDPGAL